MNLPYLGDAHDLWKGALVEYLQREGALRDLIIDRMATDPDEWTEADFGLYARLLRVERRQVIQDERTLASRKEYFAELVHDGDLFLDPDTGMGSGSLIARYVKRKELAELLGPPRDRVIAVYQHVRGNTRKRVDGCLRALGSDIDGVSWCSYESGAGAILFFSEPERRIARIARIAGALGNLLGRHAERKVWTGRCQR
jgi:hypothetical protein